MEAFHDLALAIARRADDGVGHSDQGPVDGIDQLQDRLSVVVAKDPVLVLENYDIATVQMTSGGPNADRAVRVDLHPNLSEGGGWWASIDETHQIDVQVRSTFAERGHQSRREPGDTASCGRKGRDNADPRTFLVPGRAVNRVEHDLKVPFR